MSAQAQYHLRKLPGVAIVVINWNAWKETIGCLETLGETTYSEYRVIVLDNGSADGSADHLRGWIRNRQPETRCGGEKYVLLTSKENIGFSSGVNLAVLRALTDWPWIDFIFLLGNDARLSPAALFRCVQVARHGNGAIVGAVVRSRARDEILFAGGRFPLELFVGGGDRCPRDQRFWVTARTHGAAMLIRRDIVERRFEQCGHLLDPTLFMYCDEIELCHWCRCYGYRILMAGKSIAYHDDAGSTGRRGNPVAYYYLTRNRVVLAGRLLSTGQRIGFHLWYVPTRLAIALKRILEGNYTAAKAIGLGVFDGYRGATGKWKFHPAIATAYDKPL